MILLNIEELEALAAKWFKKKVKRDSVIIEIGKDKNWMQIYRMTFGGNISKAIMRKRLMRHVVHNFVYSNGSHRRCLLKRSKGFVEQTGRIPDIRDKVHIEYLNGRDIKIIRVGKKLYEAIIECCPVIDKLYDKVNI